MKKVFLSIFALLLLLGAGCFVANPTVEGPWKLAFDLPKDWVMVTPYSDAAKALDHGVKRDDSEVWLQDSATLTPSTQVRVSALDLRRSLPDELTDLGHGFFKDNTCQTSDAAAGSCIDLYYLKTETTNYKFIILGDQALAESIILSAKIVTHFTDLSSIEVQDE